VESMEESENKGIGITLTKIMLAEWGMTVQVILFQMANAKKNNHLNDYYFCSYTWFSKLQSL
jgi:hypothetical protein